MAQKERALLVLVEDSGSIPRTHMVGSQTFITPVPGGPIPSSDLHGQQACTWCICELNTHTLKISLEKKKKDCVAPSCIPPPPTHLMELPVCSEYVLA